MISKIYIVGSNKQWEEDELLKACETHNIPSSFLFPTDFQIILSPKLMIRDKTKNDFPNPETDFFIIRRSRGMFEITQSLVLALKTLNFRYSDSFWGMSTNLNKELSLIQATSGILPHPLGTTIVFANDTDIVNFFSYFPCVLKPVFGRHGEGVMIIDSSKELVESVSKITERHILQRKIDIRAEYRIFIVYNEVLGIVEKKTSPGSQVANYAAGATFFPSNLPKAILDEAVRLCSEQWLDIAGVDIAEDAMGNFFLLEINRCPEFKALTQATGIPIAERILSKIFSLF